MWAVSYLLPLLASGPQVTVVPTVFGVKAGENTAHFTGVQSKQFIEKFLDRLEGRSIVN